MTVVEPPAITCEYCGGRGWLIVPLGPQAPAGRRHWRRLHGYYETRQATQPDRHTIVECRCVDPLLNRATKVVSE